ncbi:MAG TPA: tRNA (adenosine(37)-N6)-threonylcarbamoyltransferase complex dimerization subunit type 1 TsaB [Candidatus Gastranaerophilales bacterium]|nr:tRNA (adenosine(37)-N6)-threonylcarbamoyltransferase complex dimerization subunit type 1 TsaB [Candidatus Gastranaerophilales bacterium]
MNILAFDTSFNIMYVTLGKDNTILDSRKIKSTEQNYNSAYLVSTIADILKENNLVMKDIEALGVNIGPGSFTGLRASVTVARVIAQQLDIPVAGIPSFQIYSELNKTEKQTFCIMDARRGMAYIAVYDQNSEPILQPCVVEYEKALEMAQSEDFFIISDDRMAKQLEEKSLHFLNFYENEEDFGVFLLKQTLKCLQAQDSMEFNWRKLKPLYIQPPAITIANKNNIT